MTLAINLATRGRPALLLETCKTDIDAIGLRNTVFMISADADDQPTIGVLPEIEDYAKKKNVRFLASIEAREDTIAAKWNRVLIAVPHAEVYMPACDDRAMITPGFDERILKAASRWPDGVGVVFNYLDNLSFTAIQAMTRGWAEAVGNLYAPVYPYWFVDHEVSDLAEMTDRFAFADVTLEYKHLPPTQEMREPAFWAWFFDARRLKRRAIAHGIIKNGADEPWRKQILLERHPLVETYSKMVNDSVRMMSVSRTPKDERYMRVKRAAIEMIKNELLPELKAEELKAAA